MRSRYTAFVLGDESWLAASWDPSTRPARIHVSDDDEWLGLTVVSARGGALDQEGVVHFVAEVRRGGAVIRLEERSRFRRHDGAWVYLDGTIT